MSRPIPADREGYAVDVVSRIVHTRYARHAEGLPRTRSLAGAYVLLANADAEPCPLCYPAPPEPEPAPMVVRRWSGRRRAASSAGLTWSVPNVTEEDIVDLAKAGKITAMQHTVMPVSEPELEPVDLGESHDLPVRGEVEA